MPTDQSQVQDSRPNADVDTLEYDGAATHSDPIEGEITRHYYECPVCEKPLCEWTACPYCSWYNEDVWERTLEGSA